MSQEKCRQCQNPNEKGICSCVPKRVTPSIENRYLKREIGFCFGLAVGYVSRVSERVDFAAAGTDDPLPPDLISDIRRGIAAWELYRARVLKALDEMEKNEAVKSSVGS